MFGKYGKEKYHLRAVVGYKQHSIDTHKASVKSKVMIDCNQELQVSTYLIDGRPDPLVEHYAHTGSTRVFEEGLCQEAAKEINK